MENPYWQYFSGMKYFEHELPIHPMSMTRWRKRIGEAGAEALLKETIEAGPNLKAVKKTQLKRVNIDTTVEETWSFMWIKFAGEEQQKVFGDG